MLKTDLEFKKGLFFIRLDGTLLKKDSLYFRENIFPIVLQQEFKYIVLNLDKLNAIDNVGLTTLYDLYKIVKEFCGRVSLCNLNNKIKESMINSEVYNYIYSSDNELTSLGVFKI